MSQDIKLSGGEITVLKAIGLSGTPVYGKLLLGKLEDSEKAEFLETLNDLIALGYVVSNKVNVRTLQDVETAFFRASPAHARDLRDAIRPGQKRDQQRAGRDRRDRRR
ncbi:MAG TPA: hypothetical protein VF551_01510 [Chthoniobacterales bacterium]